MMVKPVWLFCLILSSAHLLLAKTANYMPTLSHDYATSGISCQTTCSPKDQCHEATCQNEECVQVRTAHCCLKDKHCQPGHVAAPDVDNNPWSPCQELVCRDQRCVVAETQLCNDNDECTEDICTKQGCEYRATCKNGATCLPIPPAANPVISVTCHCEGTGHTGFLCDVPILRPQQEERLKDYGKIQDKTSSLKEQAEKREDAGQTTEETDTNLPAIIERQRTSDRRQEVPRPADRGVPRSPPRPPARPIWNTQGDSTNIQGQEGKNKFRQKDEVEGKNKFRQNGEAAARREEYHNLAEKPSLKTRSRHHADEADEGHDNLPKVIGTAQEGVPTVELPASEVEPVPVQRNNKLRGGGDGSGLDVDSAAAGGEVDRDMQVATHHRKGENRRRKHEKEDGTRKSKHQQWLEQHKDKLSEAKDKLSGAKDKLSGTQAATELDGYAPDAESNLPRVIQTGLQAVGLTSSAHDELVQQVKEQHDHAPPSTRPRHPPSPPRPESVTPGQPVEQEGEEIGKEVCGGCGVYGSCDEGTKSCMCQTGWSGEHCEVSPCESATEVCEEPYECVLVPKSKEGYRCACPGGAKACGHKLSSHTAAKSVVDSDPRAGSGASSADTGAGLETWHHPAFIAMMASMLVMVVLMAVAGARHFLRRKSSGAPHSPVKGYSATARQEVGDDDFGYHDEEEMEHGRSTRPTASQNVYSPSFVRVAARTGQTDPDGPALDGPSLAHNPTFDVNWGDRL